MKLLQFLEFYTQFGWNLMIDTLNRFCIGSNSEIISGNRNFNGCEMDAVNG